MPIGAALGGAAIMGVGQVASGVIGADAQSDAAQTAADTSLQTAQLNNQLYRDMWAQNYGVLAPYAQGGLPAMYQLNDMLGLSGYPVPAAPTPPGYAPAPTAGGDALSSYSPGGTYQTAPVAARTPYYAPTTSGIIQTGRDAAANGGALSAYLPTGERPYATGGQDLAYPTIGPQAAGPGTVAGAGGGIVTTGHPALDRINASRAERGLPPIGRPSTGTPAPAGGAAPAAGGSALSAWDRFRNSTNYQFRLDEGMGALNQQFAAHGALDSGAAVKAAIKYNQNFAANELSNYMNLLAGQQAMGLSAAGAVAGVGTTYAGNVAAQNTAAGNAAANAALMSGQAQAGMWGSIGQGIGTVGGALYQYGMGQQFPQYGYAPAGSTGGIVVNPNQTSAGAVNSWAPFG